MLVNKVNNLVHLLPTDNNWCGRPHTYIFQTTKIELKLLSHNSFPSTALTKRVSNVYYFKFKPPKPLCLGFSWFQLNFCLTVNSLPRAVAIATVVAYLTPVNLISNSSCGKKKSSHPVRSPMTSAERLPLTLALRWGKEFLCFFGEH